MERGLGCVPRSEWGHRLRSIALSALGRDVEALDAALEAIMIDPENWRGRTRLSRCYVAMDRLAEADATLAKATELAPDGSAIFVQWSRVAWLRKDMPRAEALSRKAVSLDPGSADALRSLATVLQNYGPSREASDLEAFKLFSQAMAIDPSRRDVRQGLIDTGINVLVVPPAIVAGICAVCATLICPSGWWMRIGLPLFVVLMTWATYRRQARKLTQARPGGVALVWRLWWDS